MQEPQAMFLEESLGGGAYETTPDGINRKSLDILPEKPLCKILMVNLYKLKESLDAYSVNYTLGGYEPANG